MKALILAAGLGTRLLPHTRTLPKPLFTLLGKPVLEHSIQQLADAGCTQIIINTHHLHRQIESFVQTKDFGLDIQLLHEPDILETGGAIANAKSFLNDTVFFVVNADIISSIEFKKLYQTHVDSNCIATLVLHDDERFNKVGIDDQGYILNFNTPENGHAFTGVQVVSPQIYDHLPQKDKFSSIEVYKNLCPTKQIKAWIQKQIFWSDIGTCEDYQRTCVQLLSAKEFGVPMEQIKQIEIAPLAGDGSDRKWYRATHKEKSVIVSDHGICQPETDNLLQINAFVNIGNHLISQAIPAPRILNHEILSGIVILEDLGNTHLADLILKKKSDEFTLDTYKKVIDKLIRFSSKGKPGFQSDWTCQTATYSKALILEKECQYFMEQFVQGYSGLNTQFKELASEFDTIADKALLHGYTGLMHRDMQSKNIMIRDNRIYFIDFQSARIGPLQYDLASLLIDPYVNLGEKIKTQLLHYTMDKLLLNTKQKNDFLSSYNYCCLTRNLQFLGAFSFLSQIKNKPGFERYIPDAVVSLDQIINDIGSDKLPKLHCLTQTIKNTAWVKEKKSAKN